MLVKVDSIALIEVPRACQLIALVYYQLPLSLLRLRHDRRWRVVTVRVICRVTAIISVVIKKHLCPHVCPIFNKDLLAALC